ncbi:MAG: Asp-tRNA(Asn)/Glu-tRNA(Gln) amidotransferase subunit GatC [SAR202 cluster bacterium]|nr:Asp-tRNA(Asn)/Glu-tRNA(Gln) amidotransferase subunit GatC [SAR202 cluster bacterium]
MKLTSEEVRHIALLARVGMTDQEIQVMRDQLSNTLDHFQSLQEVETEGVEPTGHAADVTSIMREDRLETSGDRADFLAGVPRREGDLVRVRPVLD